MNIPRRMKDMLKVLKYAAKCHLLREYLQADVLKHFPEP